MKGILLAGGNGTRLDPLTTAVSKQLLPVYNKPMVFYPLSVLMLAGIREILVITTPSHLALFRALLGDGSHLGISITYEVQEQASGIAEALIIGSDHVGDDDVALILGDNIFHGPRFSPMLREIRENLNGCVLFGYSVTDPHRYGVGEIDESGTLLSLEEKPAKPRSNLAVTGLYFYDNDVLDIAKNVKPSARGELEITDVNRAYMEMNRARMVNLGRGFAWLDTGTYDSLLQAGQYVQVLEQRQGTRIACVEEIAFRMGFIDAEQCARLGERSSSDYGRYVRDVAREGW